MLVDGRHWHEERAGRERREGPLAMKAAGVQLCNNQQKRKGVMMRLSSQREVAARQLTWRCRLRNGGGGSNDDNGTEMITMQKRRQYGDDDDENNGGGESREQREKGVTAATVGVLLSRCPALGGGKRDERSEQGVAAWGSTATATEVVAEGVAWWVRAGGGALELMAGRGYAIWGMQKKLCLLCISRWHKFTCAYTVPKLIQIRF